MASWFTAASDTLPDGRPHRGVKTRRLPVHGQANGLRSRRRRLGRLEMRSRRGTHNGLRFWVPHPAIST
jgi:hypothetical protein